MSRPDWERLGRNVSTVYEGAGETATLHTYVSADAGSPQFGVAGAQSYTTRIISGVFREPTAYEMAMPGGQVIRVDLYFTTHSALGVQDEVVRGSARYVVAGSAQPSTLGGGRVTFRQPLRFASNRITADFGRRAFSPGFSDGFE